MNESVILCEGFHASGSRNASATAISRCMADCHDAGRLSKESSDHEEHAGAEIGLKERWS